MLGRISTLFVLGGVLGVWYFREMFSCSAIDIVQPCSCMHFKFFHALNITTQYSSIHLFISSFTTREMEKKVMPEYDRVALRLPRHHKNRSGAGRPPAPSVHWAKPRDSGDPAVWLLAVTFFSC
jgi:hypothetical protein